MTVDSLERGAWRNYHSQDLSKPLAAALSAFVNQGYHGTSIRNIASLAGLSVPGLYHHYPSKHALLVGVTSAAMGELLTHSRQAIEEAGSSPLDRFDAVVESLLRFHMFRREQAFVASTEIRSMEQASRAVYIAQRDEQQQMLDHIVLEGVEQGAFNTPYPTDASRAVTTMCVAVSSWYRTDGPLSPDELVERYLRIAQRVVGAKERNA